MYIYVLIAPHLGRHRRFAVFVTLNDSLTVVCDLIHVRMLTDHLVYAILASLLL